MGRNTHISWTSASWNPWQGCRRKSEGCRYCYMFRDMIRYGKDPKHIHRSADATFNLPMKLQREVEAGRRSGEGRMVFTCSWSDWFIKEADAWREEAWAVIRRCPDLIFQVLTKRPERMADHLPVFWPEIRDRCWLGASAEDQKNYDARRPYIDSDLAPVMWWSLEPLLGPIAMGFDDYTHKPSWVVVGGESGLLSEPIRPMHPAWPRSIRDECHESGVAYHFKQWGEWLPDGQSNPYLADVIGGRDSHALRLIDLDGRDFTGGPESNSLENPLRAVRRVGKKAAGRVLDGREWNEFPSLPNRGPTAHV